MKKVISILLLIALISTMPSYPISASAKSTSELQNEKAVLESERKSIEEKIEKLKNQTNSYEEIASEYNRKMSVLEKELAVIDKQAATAVNKYESVVNKISNLKKEISRLKEKIKKSKLQIQEKEEEIKSCYADFSERMKAIYISGSYSLLEALFDCEDFSQFLMRLQLTDSVAELDKAQMDAIHSQIDKLTELNAQLKSAKEDVTKKTSSLSKKEKQLKAEKEAAEKIQREYSAKKDEIASSKAETEKAIATLQQKTGKYEADLSVYDDEISNAIKAIEASKNTTEKTTNPNNNSPSNPQKPTQPKPTQPTGSFWLTYPVPGHTNIYCGFYGYENHGGIDFSDSTIYGARVVAAAPGTVIIRKELNYSYGHYVVVYHGKFDGYYYATCYAHMSSINSGATLNTYLNRGQTIGAVGSTGNSSGPHLHFELRRYNSSLTYYDRIDPTKFLS